MAPRSKKRQLSTIDKQPPEIRELIATLRQDHGATIDQIMDKLRELEVDVSRSALGRHVKGLAEVGEEMRRNRELAKALVARFGDEPENHLARLNLELMHGLVMRCMTAVQEGEDGEPVPVTFGPEEVMFLSTALQKLSSAQKTDTDRALLMKKQAAAEAAKAVDRVAARTPRGLTRDTVDAIKREILGITS